MPIHTFEKQDYDAINTKWLVERVGIKQAINIQNLTIEEMELAYMRLRKLSLIPITPFTNTST